MSAGLLIIYWTSVFLIFDSYNTKYLNTKDELVQKYGQFVKTKKVDTKDLVKFTLFRQAKKHLNLETKEKKSN